MRYYHDQKTKTVRRFDDTGTGERWARDKRRWTPECCTERACQITLDVPLREDVARTFTGET